MSMWTRLQPAYAANMWNEALNKRLGTEVIVLPQSHLSYHYGNFIDMVNYISKYCILEFKG